MIPTSLQANREYHCPKDVLLFTFHQLVQEAPFAGRARRADEEAAPSIAFTKDVLRARGAAS